MSKLTDLGNCNALLELKERFEADEARRREEERQARIKEHKRTHIFTSYDRALVYLTKHPGKAIEWHAKTLVWDEEKGMFKSYEQDFDYEGVNCWDVIRYYTREELLQEHQDFCERKKQELGKDYDENWYLDEFGKLAHVYAYDPVKIGFNHY